MPHYQIYRLEPRRGSTNSTEYPIGYQQAASADEAVDDATAGLRIRLRDGERIFAVMIKDEGTLRQARAIHRERDRSIFDCRDVLERISYSVD